MTFTLGAIYQFLQGVRVSGIWKLGTKSSKKQMQKEVYIYIYIYMYMTECYDDNCSFSNSDSKKDTDDMQYFTYVFVKVFHSIYDLFATLASSSPE